MTLLQAPQPPLTTEPPQALAWPDHATFLAALQSGIASIPGDMLRQQRWFGAKEREIVATRAEMVFVLGQDSSHSHQHQPWWYVVLQLRFENGETDRYALPLTLATGGIPAANSLTVTLDGLFGSSNQPLLLTDALRQPAVAAQLLLLFPPTSVALVYRDPDHAPGQCIGLHTTVAWLPIATTAANLDLTPRLIESEQSNSSTIYGQSCILKLFRRLQAGMNPDLEVSHFLTTKTNFSSTPKLLGWLELTREDTADSMDNTALGVMHEFIANDGDAWSNTLGHLARVLTPASGQLDPKDESLAAAGALGGLTAEMHAALASDSHDPAFAPERITAEDVALWRNDLAAELQETLASLRLVLADDETQPLIRQVLQQEAALEAQIADLEFLVGAAKTRFHGDYHLGQILATPGRGPHGFVVLDFEGEPLRPLEARRAKHTPLKDVAGLGRSLSYAAAAGQFAAAERGQPDHAALAAAWLALVSERFWAAYQAACPPALLPARPQRVLRVLSMEKALYELRYEINHRPTWLRVPLHGLLQMLD
jgi:trehalose synthase-fused probable maltokinase